MAGHMRRIADLEANNRALARERNEARRQAMEIAQTRDRYREEMHKLRRQLESATAMVKELAHAKPGTTLMKNGYVFENGVLIHESTARAEKNLRILNEDLNRGLARAAADSLAAAEVREGDTAPEVVIPLIPVVPGGEALQHPLSRIGPVPDELIIDLDPAEDEDSTAIAIAGPDGQFSHFEYPEEDEALGRDREHWGPGGQEEDTEEVVTGEHGGYVLPERFAREVLSRLEEASSEEGVLRDDQGNVLGYFDPDQVVVTSEPTYPDVVTVTYEDIENTDDPNIERAVRDLEEADKEENGLTEEERQQWYDDWVNG